MAYSTLAYSPNEILTSAKMNQASDNDEALRDGSGILTDSILERHILDGEVTASKRSEVAKVGIISAATLGTTGNKAITGIGFKPKLVRFKMLQNPGTVNTIYGDGAMTDSDQYTTAATGDGSNRARYSSTSNCISGVGSGSATPFILASKVSMNADGFTINVTTASNAFDWAYEAIA